MIVIECIFGYSNIKVDIGDYFWYCWSKVNNLGDDGVLVEVECVLIWIFWRFGV